jgi:RNA polymerase sigma factor (TIGR02999 family)
MAQPPAHDVTRLLEQLNTGNKQALESLMPLVYAELRRQAARYLRRERQNHTLQPTALVNEAFLRLVDQKVNWQNRSHFFGVAAQAMRRVLVDHARAHGRIKRGGPAPKVTLDEGMVAAQGRSVDLLALDQALERLAAIDARQARVVELRFFGGLSVEETAEVMNVSPATVKREWSMAKAWLHAKLESGAHEHTG